MLTILRNLLLLIAVLMMATPASAQDACVEVEPAPEECCEVEDLYCVESTDEGRDESAAEGCCDTSCDDCGLPCCGAASSVLTSKPDLGLRGSALAGAPAPAEDLCVVDLDPLYHPPRV